MFLHHVDKGMALGYLFVCLFYVPVWPVSVRRICVNLKSQWLLPTNALKIKQPVMEITELPKNLVAVYFNSLQPIIVDLETEKIQMSCTGNTK